MDLELTVAASDTGACADVHARAPDSAPATGLVAALRAVVGAASDVPLSVDGRPLAATGSVADCGLRPGCVVTAGPAPAPPGPPAVVALQVDTGPDAGRRVVLPVGEHVVGRDAGCAVVIDDSAVSGRHLRLSVAGSTVTVTDLASANGTTAGGRSLPAGEHVSLPLDAVITVGGSEVRVVPVTVPLAARELPDGRVAVARPPRLDVVPPALTVTFPPPPVPGVRTRIPLLAAIAPMVAGVVLAVVLHQWQLLAFTALSPVMVLSQAASDRWHGRRSNRAARREHAAATAGAAASLATELAAERGHRERAFPPAGVLTAAAAERRPQLWHRDIDDSDALRLRLGRGDVAAAVTVTGGPGAAVLSDTAVTVDLRPDPVLGVCGPAHRARGLLRSLVIQAAALHDPEQLTVVVLAAARSDEWSWARWLPHTTPRHGEPCRTLVGFDPAEVSQRVSEITDTPCEAARHTLIVVDATGIAADPAPLTALRRLLVTAAEPGRRLSVIWAAATLAGLPSGCVSVADLAVPGGAGMTVRRRGTTGPTRVAPDLLSADVAAATARALAPLRHCGAASAVELPRVLPWRRVAGLDLDDAAAASRALTRRWALGATTVVTLGTDASGPVVVDLCRDGPHALVAGTTGAGKSELLLALVAGLAAGNQPADLSLLLVDHKGGATFAPCARLPHTFGMITDLDAASTTRALMSLTAELRRRERLLAAAAAVEIEGYLAGRSPDDERLARLVIIIDEFAALAEEQPDFIGGLIGIAQRGRSLGIHLVLATQRPDGVVSADIRANTRLRICLGVARENESRDVIDSPAAAAISRDTPGRALLRAGPGELREFQSAQIRTAPTGPEELRVTIVPAALLGRPEPPSTDTRREEHPAGTTPVTDLELLIDAACLAAAALPGRPAVAPWLPPLPDRLHPANLPAAAAPGAVSWGMVDLPAIGQQHPLELDLATGTVTVITGAARSGRTTAATTLALAAAAARSPDELRLWAIDAGSGLSRLERLPHCGSVVPGHDVDRVERLLEYLSREAGSRRHRPADAATRDPVLMLVVDSWETVAAGHDRDAHRVADRLLRLAADAPAAGLHLVVATDRTGLTGRLPAVATDRIVLRLADPADLTLVGVAAKDVPRHQPPGRGIRARDLAVVQVAADDGTAELAATAWPAPEQPARRFDPLPARLSIDDPRVTPAAGSPRIVLGLAADDLQPVSLDPGEIGTSFLVAGPPGSGRTSALQLVVRQLTGRRVAVCCRPGSPLLTEPGVVHLPADDQEQAADVLDAMQRGAAAAVGVVVDDADLLSDGPLWPRLEALVRGDGSQVSVVAMSGSTEAMVAAFRGPVALARRGRTGLLLRPGRANDGELLGVQLPARLSPSGPPGRGWVALRGVATALQLACVTLPDDEVSRPGRRP